MTGRRAGSSSEVTESDEDEDEDEEQREDSDSIRRPAFVLFILILILIHPNLAPLARLVVVTCFVDRVCRSIED
jgi:hypothetical protein